MSPIAESTKVNSSSCLLSPFSPVRTVPLVYPIIRSPCLRLAHLQFTHRLTPLAGRVPRGSCKKGSPNEMGKDQEKRKTLCQNIGRMKGV